MLSSRDLIGKKIEKPRFNSGFEKHLFFILREEVFSIYSVIPNIDLTYLFDNAKILKKLKPREKEFLDSFHSHVDICVANSKTLIPFLGIEVDSQYHGHDHQRMKDRVKNRIFQKLGVPLLRIEPADYFHQKYSLRCRNVKHEIALAISKIGGRYDILASKLS